MLFAPAAAYCAGRAIKAWGVASIQGRRSDQEDRYAVVTRLPQDERLAFFGVYDGHGGKECAQHAAAFLHDHVTKSPAIKAGAGTGQGVTRALVDAFTRTEKDFLEEAHLHRYRSGSTALTAVLRMPEPGDGAGSGGEITVAHVGDSRAVLCRSGKAVALTEDHKPEDAAERKRIEALGGFVSERGYCMRVQGVLAMSRALGNRLLKPFVSATPSVSTTQLSAADEFVVLATDGLYDVFDNQEVVDLVRKADEPMAASQMLVQRAFEEGSCDNITVIVVALKGYKNYAGLDRGDSDTPEVDKARERAAGRGAQADGKPAGRKGWFFGRAHADDVASSVPSAHDAPAPWSVAYAASPAEAAVAVPTSKL